MAAHTDHRYYVLGGSKNGGAAAGESPGTPSDGGAGGRTLTVGTTHIYILHNLKPKSSQDVSSSTRDSQSARPTTTS
jgi:hypothetical protein